MCSFGESISLTPLQLRGLMGAIANGGTLYYLQHPTSPEQVANFTPKVKRKLEIGPTHPGDLRRHGRARSSTARPAR